MTDGRVILAAFGWLILATSPQPSGKDQAEKKQGQTQPSSRPPPVTVTISKPVEIVQPHINAPPCGPNQYQAKDDLCAQWKAADAAGRAATWAMIGTIIAAIGTIGLYWQIKLTPDEVRTLTSQEPPIVFGNVIYADPSGQRYQIHFAFRPTAFWVDDYRRIGGRAYNREEELQG